jgi:fumarylacetoacetate (FAA) hydrolase
MKLGSLRAGGRDGTLVVVSGDGRRMARAVGIAPTLQAALDDWSRAAPALRALAARLEGGLAGEPVDQHEMASPLPRAYDWLDGSAFLSHVERVRRARGAAMPPELKTEPLVYQGGSGTLMGPREPFALGDPAWGLDIEAELAVITGDVPRGVSSADAAPSVLLVCLINDWTLRGLVPAELAKGFGFVISKPPTAFAPWAVTPDELPWHDGVPGGRPALRVTARINDRELGTCEAREMHFSFGDLIAHVARMRALGAGTIIGSGTVSNQDPARGVCCLVEKRALETIATGDARTGYLRAGDRVQITAHDERGRDIFGAIDEVVT